MIVCLSAFSGFWKCAYKSSCPIPEMCRATFHVRSLWFMFLNYGIPKIISNSNQPLGIMLSKDWIVIVNIVIHDHLSKEGISIGQVYDSFVSSSFISLIPARHLVVLRRNPAVDFFGIGIMSGVHQVFVTVSTYVLYISRYLILKFRR